MLEVTGRQQRLTAAKPPAVALAERTAVAPTNLQGATSGPFSQLFGHGTVVAIRASGGDW